MRQTPHRGDPCEALPADEGALRAEAERLLVNPSAELRFRQRSGKRQRVGLGLIGFVFPQEK